MREMILKAVANPPKILWGPFLPTLLNIGIQFPIMFMFIGLGDVNPLLFVFSIVLVHGAVVLAGTCLLYTSPSPRDSTSSRMPSSA